MVAALWGTVTFKGDSASCIFALGKYENYFMKAFSYILSCFSKKLVFININMALLRGEQFFSETSHYGGGGGWNFYFFLNKNKSTVKSF